MKNLRIIETSLLSNNWYTLNKVTYAFENEQGVTENQVREVYDRGNGATILLYNKENKTVILTQQFRLPTYLNGNASGMLIESCAGLLDKDNAEDCIKKETEEETGFKIDKVQKVFEVYMSPGSVTEILYFFVAEYESHMKIGAGGGLAEEQEKIEVLELNFDAALEAIASGEIKDAKTIMLLYHAKIHHLMD